MSWYPSASAAVLFIAAMLLAGPGGVGRAIRATLATLRRQIADSLLVIILALLFHVLARRYMDVT
ncbi:MAG: hypothetical protein ACREL6_11620, partial [Gemmatimonadales bacterium]